MYSHARYIEQFAQFIADGQTLPVRKLIYDILLGVPTSNSLILSRIADALDEDGHLESTVRRLSVGLQSDELHLELLWFRLRKCFQGDLRRSPPPGCRSARQATPSTSSAAT